MIVIFLIATYFARCMFACFCWHSSPHVGQGTLQLVWVEWHAMQSNKFDGVFMLLNILHYAQFLLPKGQGLEIHSGDLPRQVLRT